MVTVWQPSDMVNVLVKHQQQFPADVKGPQPPQEIESVRPLSLEGVCFR